MQYKMGTQPAEEKARIMRGEWPFGLVNPQVKEKYVEKCEKMNEPTGDNPYVR